MRTLLVTVVLAATASLSWADSAHWNQFRGPNGQGISVDGDPPITFGPDEAVAWKADMPSGHSSPVVWGDRVFLTAFADGQLQTLLAIRSGGRGDVSDSHIAWRAEIGLSEMPSPLFYQGRLYFVRNGGVVTAYSRSGERVFRERLTPGGTYAASPVAAAGRIYAASDAGTIVVFRAGEKLEVLARNELGEGVIATPAIVGKHLLVRTERHLWAFGPQME